VHTPTSPFSAAAPVDIPGNRIQNALSEFRLTVDVLQRSEDWDDFIPAIDVQLHIQNILAVESHLWITGFSHGHGSSKVERCYRVMTPYLLTEKVGKRSHLRGAFFQQAVVEICPPRTGSSSLIPRWKKSV
jgi:hypothetical protein